MMDKTMLHTAIKDAAEGFISKHKTQEVRVTKYKVSDGQIVEDSPQISNEIPSGDDGIKAMIDIIAEAVAQEVIAHIQAHLQLVGGNASFSSYNAAGTWNGTGGGVVGPVVVTAATGVSGSEKLNIAEGKFQ